MLDNNARPDGGRWSCVVVIVINQLGSHKVSIFGFGQKK